MGDQVFDLFGNPVRPNKGQRGRPAFEVTERNSNKVKLLLALGWSNERVANAVGCSLATLKRYFRADLMIRDQMRDRLDAERMMVLAEQASRGNVGAAKELDRMIQRNDQMVADRSLRETREERGEPKGKKLVAADLAAQADCDLQAELDAAVGFNRARH